MQIELTTLPGDPPHRQAVFVNKHLVGYMEPVSDARSGDNTSVFRLAHGLTITHQLPLDDKVEALRDFFQMIVRDFQERPSPSGSTFSRDWYHIADEEARAQLYKERGDDA